MAANYQRIADMSTAVSLTIPTGYWSAIIQAEAGSIRVRNDDVAPTSATGLLLTDGDAITITERLDEVKLWAANSTPNANVIYGKDTGPSVLVIA